MEHEIDQINSMENQIAQNGLVLEENESLQRRLEKLEALYEATKRELDSTREELAKVRSAQHDATAEGVETKETCISRLQSQGTAEHDSKQTATSTPVQRNTHKIFVGNLSDYTTRSEIRQLFEAHGTVVEADIVKNYGFVHMETEEECRSAIDALDGYMLHGKVMDVKASTTERKGHGDQQSTSSSAVSGSVTSTKGDSFKIFVGNLSDHTTSLDLREVFEVYGTVVEADVVKNYGFVHMEKKEEGLAAIKAVNCHMLRGKPIVAEASTGTRKGGNQTPKIFIGNVHRNCGREELKSLFEKYGKVVEVGILTNYAFVHMDDDAQAQKAIRELDGHELHGMRLTVQKSTSRGRQAGGGYSDQGFSFGPVRYEPYPPPPPHRYVRDRMIRDRDMYEPRLPPVLPYPDYPQHGRYPQPSRPPFPPPSMRSYTPSDRRPY
ncbi:RNA-binding protein lark-like isoform X2 [Homarus americanus]|uniref:RNA-binding protein lark-like isoform X2 n=1 Tax=Homarus americanus TaxID=6706 RepID=UPI001C47353F|nr:RNA-binding protein lark-like isoform X2 [Homarus americanus]